VFELCSEAPTGSRCEARWIVETFFERQALMQTKRLIVLGWSLACCVALNKLGAAIIGYDFSQEPLNHCLVSF
jgi:hypothetical protein